MGRLNPVGYHWLNLLIHLAAAAALGGCLHRMRVAPGIAAAVAALWALHPLQTEAVAYISGRSESLMGLCYLCAIYAFLRGPESGTWKTVSVVACWLGMATKEVMVSAPLFILLCDRFLVSGSFRRALHSRPMFYALLFASWILLLALVAWSGNRGGTAGAGTGLSVLAYLAVQLHAIPHYIRLVFWPSPLIADYGRRLFLPPVAVVAGGCGVLVLMGLTIWLFRRGSPWALAAAFVGLVLAPSSSVVPISTELMAERRMYLPSAAVIAVAAIGAAQVLRTSRQRWIAFAATAVALAVVTRARAAVYRSPGAFWADVVSKAPQNAGAHNNLGNVADLRGDRDAAEQQFRQALMLVPGFADANANLGRLKLEEGDWQAAIGLLEQALRTRPDEDGWRRALATAYYRGGQAAAARNALPAAASYYAKALDFRPDSNDARIDYAGVLMEQGKWAEAEVQLRKAIALQPAAADAHNDLGGVLAQQGRWKDAAGEFEAALRLKPDYLEAQRNLERVRSLGGLATPVHP